MTKRRRADALPVPQNVEEAQALLDEIGQLDRAIAGHTDQIVRDISALKEAHEARIAPLAEEAETKFLALKAWFEANGDKLPKDRKSLDWPQGTLGYRLTPPSVKVVDQEEAIKAIQAFYRDDLLTFTTTLNKPAILRACKADEGLGDKIGVRIVQTQEFYARAANMEGERKAKIKQQKVRESAS